LASSSDDTTVRIWNLTTNSPKFNFAGHTSSVYGLKLISSDLLASGSWDKTIKLWNITNGQLIRNLTGHGGSILWSIDFLSDSQTLVSGSIDQTIKLWNIITGQFLNSFNTGLNIRALTVLTAIGRSSKKSSLFLQKTTILIIP
jgi:WD40 repeat protein